MRFLTGLIVGVLLTVGVAYVVDASGPNQTDAASNRMVNWTVVDTNVRVLSADIRDGWNRLMGGAKRLDRQTGI